MNTMGAKMLTNTKIDALKGGIKDGRPLPKGRVYRVQDSRNLYLVVAYEGGKRWEYRYIRHGAVRVLNLGPYDPKAGMGIAAARAKRDELEVLRANGQDPVATREIERAQTDAEAAQARAARARARHARLATADRLQAGFNGIPAAAPGELTLQQLCEGWMAARPDHWEGDTREQIGNSLANHIYPRIGQVAAATLRARDLLAVLTLVLHGDADRKPLRETARKLRIRLDAAYRWGQLAHDLPGNPAAALRDEIGALIDAARQRVPVQNRAAVPTADLPTLLAAMRDYKGQFPTKAMAWTLAYTAVRTDSARMAEWKDVDLDAGLWTIPANNMKAITGQKRTDYVVPLSRQMIDLLTRLKALTGERRWVFLNLRKPDRPISENAVLTMLEELGYKGVQTGHGFRTNFSTVCNEAEMNKDVIEACLAHAPSDAVRAAYNQAKWLTPRAKLLQWWADELDRMVAEQAKEKGLKLVA